MFARLRERSASWQDEQVRIWSRHDDLFPIHFLFQNFRKSDLRRKPERLANRAAAKIAIDQQCASAGQGHRNSEGGRDGRFTLVSHGAGDEKRLWTWPVARHEENG